MKKASPSHVPRPDGVSRIDGIDYADLGEHFGYALKRAQIASFEAFSAATRATGTRQRELITPPRYTALVLLEANPGIGQSALGEALGTARSGAMMLADWLGERGLAERRPRPDDGRAWGLFLTTKGETLVRKLKRRVRTHDRGFSERLDPSERRELLRLLEKLTG